MDNFIAVTDGRPLAAVEKKLAKYLPGLDVRLFPLSPHQGVLRGPLLHALQIEYPATPAAAWLAVLGISDLKAVDDATTLALLSTRDAIDLPARAPLPVAARVDAAGFDWHLQAAGVPAAWQLVDPVNGPDAIAWGPVAVGQIDTGYTAHPAFGFPAAPWLDTASAQTFFPTSLEGPNFDTELGGGRDNGNGASAGHGTRIGATICGRDAAASGGAYYGVAPGVPLVPVRITDFVVINHAQDEFAQAVDHLLARGVVAINVSLGIFPPSMTDALKDAVNRAYDAGVVLCCAAGNHVNSVVGPARLARTVAVGGVTRLDQPWSGSSFGDRVDFSAPAADLRRASVKRTDQFSYGGGGDGTSYATAITTGVAALWHRHRGAQIAAAYPQPWQRVEAFRTLARQHARIPDGWHPDAGFGRGILDAGALLAAPLPLAESLTRR